MLQRRDDAIEALPVAGGAADAAIDHQLLGSLGDLGAHIIDMARFITGDEVIWQNDIAVRNGRRMAAAAVQSLRARAAAPDLVLTQVLGLSYQEAAAVLDRGVDPRHLVIVMVVPRPCSLRTTPSASSRA